MPEQIEGLSSASKSKQWFYPTAFCEWGPEEYSAMARVIASRQYTMGPEVEAFEAEFAARHKMKYAVMVNSGSSANLIMIATLRALGYLPVRANVFVPALAWATTYAPLLQHDCNIYLLDCDHTWNANAFGFETPDDEINLIIGCSVLGNPTYAENWKSIAGTFDAVYCEDNCESLGAVDFNGNLTGTQGLMNTFSFFYSHQISAIEGGAIVTDSEPCARMARILRNHGWAKEAPNGNNFHKEYNFTHFGYNVRPLEMHAAIAMEQLKKLDRFNQIRAANHRLFQRLVLDADLPITLPTPNGQLMTPFGLCFEINRNAEQPIQVRRQRLANAFRKIGIDCRLPTGGSFKEHTYGTAWRTERTPMADGIHYSGMFLGNGPTDLSHQITQAVTTMRQVLE